MAPGAALGRAACCPSGRRTGRAPLAARDYRINDRIRVPEVRVVGVSGEQLGVVRTDQALSMAREQGLDLVEVAPTAQPPVVRILDYGKFKFEQAKRDSEGRKRQKNVLLREVKMKPRIGRHDMEIKARTAVKLLRGGDKLKITVQFRGREITHPQLGRELIDEMMQMVERQGLPLVVEKSVNMEGRFMSAIVAEDRVKAAALARDASAKPPAAAEPAAVAAEGEA